MTAAAIPQSRETDGKRVTLVVPGGELRSGTSRAQLHVLNGVGATVIATRTAKREATVVFDGLPGVAVILPDYWLRDER